MDNPIRRSMQRGHRLVRALVAAWIALLVIGDLLSVNFDARPGERASPPRHWPRESRLSLAGDGTTVVMFLHPECPCSRASMTELANLLEVSPTTARTHVVMVWTDEPQDIQSNRLVSQAAAMTRIEIVHDRRADLAQQFGSHTSGDVLIFSSEGRLLFAGGLTSARGHVGPSRSFDAAAAAMCGTLNDGVETPVFGCPLY